METYPTEQNSLQLYLHGSWVYCVCEIRYECKEDTGVMCLRLNTPVCYIFVIKKKKLVPFDITTFGNMGQNGPKVIWVII